MGLDTTHGAWHGPYSSFMDWRKEIAKQIGLNLKEMVGFGGTQEWDQSHPLTVLLHHSDCDGELTPEECKKVAIGLAEVLPKITNEYLKDKTQKFISGCLDAANNNENIIFK